MQNIFDQRKLKSRILRSFGASAYGQLVTIGIQVLSVPLFLYFWGAEKYGEWLILSAIPAYLSLSDIGFASVAGNEMTMLNAKNDKEGTLRVYQSGWALISCISVLFGLLVAVGVVLTKPNEILHIRHIPSHDVALILFCLAAQVLISLQGAMLTAGFRAIGNYALGIMFGNSIRFFEWAAAAVVLTLQYGPLIVAETFLACRLIGTFITWVALKKVAPWLKMGFDHGNKAVIMSLMKPAVAFMAFPLGLAFSLQGAVIVIGAILGPTSVAIFSTYRTLSRLVVQALTMVNQAIWPEISAAYGAGNHPLVRKLHRQGFIVSCWLGIAGVLVVGLCGNWFIGIWTQHKLPSQPVLLWLLLAAAYLNIFWQSSWVLLMATNQHQQISKLFLVSTLASLILIALSTGRFGIESAALVIAITEIPLLAFVMNSAIVMANDNKKNFFLAPFQIVLGRGVT